MLQLGLNQFADMGDEVFNSQIFLTNGTLLCESSKGSTDALNWKKAGLVETTVNGTKMGAVTRVRIKDKAEVFGSLHLQLLWRACILSK